MGILLALNEYYGIPDTKCSQHDVTLFSLIHCHLAVKCKGALSLYQQQTSGLLNQFIWTGSQGQSHFPFYFFPIQVLKQPVTQSQTVGMIHSSQTRSKPF
uniref:Uncharacterized protein n=1 Tax=Pyxicephalus adspersus TaxID=30357 RepID=A0AAV3AV30_PYXAD|nr:TPA: hypothetical protein GDO54_009574 [Pyxicephalus adspersus]